MTDRDLDGPVPTTAGALIRALRLIWHAAPRRLVCLSLLNLLFGAGPAVSLYLGKIVIDEVVALSRNGPIDDPLERIVGSPVLLGAVVAFVVVVIVLDAVETLAALEVAALSDQLQWHVQWVVYRKVAGFPDISLFETPEQLNHLVLAERSTARVQRLALTVGNLLTGVFVFIPVFVLSFSIAWWIPIAIFVSAAPSIWFQLRYEERGWNLEQSQAGVARRLSLLGTVLTRPQYAKEVRLLGLQSLLLGRWSGMFASAMADMHALRRRGAHVVVAWLLLSGLGSGLPYLFVVTEALRGDITLGSLALYAGLIFEVRRSLYVLTSNVTELQDIGLGATAIFRLLDLEPGLRAESVDALPPADQGGCDGEGILRLDNVNIQP